VEGTRHWVTSADGVRIGLLTAGSGPGLLLVHGGMGTIESWRGVWDALPGRWRVTAMDRRGRGSSGDADAYALDSEFADVASVAAMMAAECGGPSPLWARQNTAELAAAFPAATVTQLPGAGHEALDKAPARIAAELVRFLDGRASPA
jgi:pimeloyl-ACP methyl ester carboxylesterase